MDPWMNGSLTVLHLQLTQVLSVGVPPHGLLLNQITLGDPGKAPKERHLVHGLHSLRWIGSVGFGRHGVWPKSRAQSLWPMGPSGAADEVYPPGCKRIHAIHAELLNGKICTPCYHGWGRLTMRYRCWGRVLSCVMLISFGLGSPRGNSPVWVRVGLIRPGRDRSGDWPRV